MMNDNAWPASITTFLFTDIEKSTLLWERHGERMRPALAKHDALLRTAVERNGGRVIKTTGDGIMAVFDSAAIAATAALDAQRSLDAEAWLDIKPDMLRVRMGLHSGEAQLRDSDYFGTAVNRAARIMDLGHGGQTLLSTATTSLLQENLPSQLSIRDLGLHPLRGLRADERIYQLAAPGLADDFPPLRSGIVLAGNLPAHVSSFVGRAREMTEIRAALPGTRLLTLTGPGGTGKTRISLQIATDVQAEYEHGAWIVELAPLTDPDLVLSTVAGTLNLAAQSGDQLHDILVDYLREKNTLLILDNCEHLITASAQIATELIAACPRLTILASSREGLGVYGETTYHLPALSLPDSSSVTAENAGQSEAVQLFVERAAAAQTGFRLTPGNAAAVAQVVRRLDGIPLAIELAAARLQFFNIEQVAARLDDRFRLLTGGSRTALPRQQTLRALIDWSYDLLDEDERALFRRLSVFMGGWTFDAAESIAGPLDAYFLLPQLVSKSLVTRETPGEWSDTADTPEPRYTYLETIRQYARDRLVEAGEMEEARDRQFAYYETLSQSIDFGVGPGAPFLISGGFLQEYDNLRTIAEWAIDRYPDRLLNLLWHLCFLLADQVPSTEFITWTETALQRLQMLPPLTGDEALAREETRLKGLTVLGLLKLFLGQVTDSFRLGQDLSSQLRQKDIADPFLSTMVFYIKAQSGYFLEDPQLDKTIVEGLAYLHRQPPNPISQVMIAIALMLSAESAIRKNELELAEQHFLEAAHLLEHTAKTFLPWIEYIRLTMLLQMETDQATLRASYLEIVEELKKNHSRRLAAMADSDWAHKMRHEDNLDEALAIYRRMLVEWRELGHRAAVANVLENLAFLNRVLAQPAKASVFLGAAQRIRREVGQEMLPPEREEYDRELAALKDALTGQEFDRLWAHGSALSTDALIELALTNSEINID